MNLKEKATAPVSSVGADGKQPLVNNNKKSIADLPPKGNLQATESCPVESEKMQNKDELQTVSMTELYDTVYPPKIPIVDGLIYAGTYGGMAHNYDISGIQRCRSKEYEGASGSDEVPWKRCRGQDL